MKRPALRWPIVAESPRGARKPSLWRQLAWMAGIWLASTSALLLVAWLLRVALKT